MINNYNLILTKEEGNRKTYDNVFYSMDVYFDTELNIPQRVLIFEKDEELSLPQLVAFRDEDSVWQCEIHYQTFKLTDETKSDELSEFIHSSQHGEVTARVLVTLLNQLRKDSLLKSKQELTEFFGESIPFKTVEEGNFDEVKW